MPVVINIFKHKELYKRFSIRHIFVNLVANIVLPNL